MWNLSPQIMTTNQLDCLLKPRIIEFHDNGVVKSKLQTKKPVKAISFQEKLSILKQIEAGISRKDICEHFKCCQSTISRVLITKKTILQLAEQDKNLNRKRVAMVTYKEIDDALSKWAQEMKRNNIMITAAMAKEKAEDIAREMGQDFKPSAGWLYKWKERENVQFGKKPKVADQLIASMGNEAILKGLLERQELHEDINIPQYKSMGMLEDYSDDQQTNLEQHSNATALSQSTEETLTNFSEKPVSYGNLNVPGSVSSQNNGETNYETTKLSTQTLPNTSTPPSAKKVPYSYDPVYVLTSTGRYRKEKTFLTLLQKLEILQRLKNGEKRPDLIVEYRLSQSAMSQIVADEKKILKLAAIGQNLQMKRVRGGIFKGGETELNTWVLKKMEDGETLTRTQIKNKAKEIADRLQIDFKASTGWLEKWKARMNMDFNENQILHRKIPSYISNNSTTDEETHVSDEPHIPETIYGEPMDDEDPVDEQVDVKKELADAEEYNLDDEDEQCPVIKPFIMAQNQIYAEDISEVETLDVKPFVNTPSPPPVMPVAPERPVVPERQPQPTMVGATETIHQKILNWLSKHNIGPTASIELLTILHPVITDKPETLPQQSSRMPTTAYPNEQNQRRQPYS